MPKCTLCGRTSAKLGDLVLAKNRDSRWGMACSHCRRRNQVHPVEEGDAAREVPAVTGETLDEGRLEQLGEVLIQVRRERQADAAARRPKRRHARHDVSLGMEFSFLRGTEVYEAEVRDISEGGLRFRTEREVESGQILRIRSLEEAPFEVGRDEGHSLAEARRVTRGDDGEYEIGARFIRRISVEDKERRRHRRRYAGSNAYYRREESDVIRQGILQNISQGGFCLICDENIQEGERIDFMMRTAPPAFTAAELRGNCRVVRVREHARGRVEAGCVFTRLDVLPLESSSPEPAAPEAETP
jgi:hypothetical protein